MGFGGQKRAVRCVAHRGANASSGNIILGNIVGNAIKPNWGGTGMRLAK